MGNLQQSLIVSVPIRDAKVTLTSNWIDRLDTFTRFVFNMLAEGHDVHAIQAVTCLQTHLILEEIHRLIDWGLIDGSYELTDLGNTYEQLITVIDMFNEEDLSFYVNLFNGSVLEKQPELHEVGYGVKLKSNVTWVQTQSVNFSNAKETFVSAYLFTHPRANELSKEAIESIEVRLELQKEGPTRFYVKEVSSLEQLPYTFKKESQSDLAIIIEVPSIHISICHEELILHQTVLQTLEQLNMYDSDLLSSSAKKLLRLKKIYETKLKQEKQQFFWHPIQKVFQNQAVNETVNDRNLFTLKFKIAPPTKLLLEEMYSDLADDFYAVAEEGTSVQFVIYLDSVQLLEERM